ncbi:hypothetical protein [Dyella agri]|uniref:Uncharacterized protein n=1 Tax=Dyella agri TaxID=1926869 RepID=A0ABW8KJG3_9GAMM
MADLLLVIRAVMAGFDKATDLVEKQVAMGSQYQLLPAALRDAIDAEYAAATHG